MDRTTKIPRRYLRAIFLFTGMSLYWLWSIAGLFSAVVWYGPGASKWMLVLVANILTFAVVLVVAKRMVPLIERKGLVLAAGTVTSLGIVLATLGLNIPALEGATVPGAVLTGIGSAPLILLWRESSEQLHSKSTQRAFVSASVVLSTLLYLLFVSLPFPVTLVICSAAPLASAVLLRHSYEPGMPAADTAGDASAELPDSPETPIGAHVPWGLFACCFALAIPQGIARTTFLPYDTEAAWPVAVSCAILVVIGATALDGWLGRPQRPRRWGPLFLPAMVIVLSAATFCSIGVPLLMSTLAFASHFLFLVYVYSELDAQAAAGLLPVQIVALGLACMDAGFMTGMLFGANAGGIPGPFVGAGVLLVCAAALVARSLVARETERFAAYDPTDDEFPFGLSLERTTAKSPEDVLEERCNLAAARYGLSEREEEIMSFLVRGKSAKSIANETFISYNTVKTHMSHIYQKMGIHNREDLFGLVERAWGEDDEERTNS